MRISFSTVEFLEDQGLLSNIERAGRVCYKSEDKITDTSAQGFIQMIREKNHLSVLEHGSVYLTSKKPIMQLRQNVQYCHEVFEANTNTYKYYTNLRFVQESYPELADCLIQQTKLPDGIETFVPDLADPYRRFSFRIITDFKISEQILRHRVFSFAKESTRYCNYAKDRFNNQLSFVIPVNYTTYFYNTPGILILVDEKWYFTPDPNYTETKNLFESTYTKVEDNSYIIDFCSLDFRLHRLLLRCWQSEQDYLIDIANGEKPEDARSFMIMPTKTEKVVTGYRCDWDRFCNLRTALSAQAEIRNIARMIKGYLATYSTRATIANGIIYTVSDYIDMPIANQTRLDAEPVHINWDANDLRAGLERLRRRR